MTVPSVNRFWPRRAPALRPLQSQRATGRHDSSCRIRLPRRHFSVHFTSGTTLAVALALAGTFAGRVSFRLAAAALAATVLARVLAATVFWMAPAGLGPPAVHQLHFFGI